MSWTPAQVNDCEVWELGSALGVATHDLEEWQKDRPAPAQGALTSGRDLIAERVRAAREGGKVEAPIQSGMELMILQEAVSGRQ
jgi:hypothetical protein